MKNTFLCAESNTTTWIFVALLVVLVVVLLVVPMFTNKKRAKQTTELHNSLKPGDVIKTVGGIIGTIKSIRQITPNDKEMVIETGEGDNKTTMVFDIQALYQVMSRADEPVDAFEQKADEPAAVAPAPAEEKVEAETPVEGTADEPVEEKHEEKVDADAETASAVVEEPAEEKTAPAPKTTARKTTSAPKSTGAKKKTTTSSAQKSTKK